MPTTSTKKPATAKGAKTAKSGSTPKAAATRRPAVVPAGMITSKLTVRDQTTLPPAVRQVLGLKGGQRVGYVFDAEGVRLINPTHTAEHTDLVLQQFLVLLRSHLAAGPAAAGVVGFPPALLDRARALTADVEIDHDAPIEGAILI
ncbi:MAG: type II toxin-antitoxin system PrlF family antitoxin [Gemmatimonadota bacterium]|nr:type II toxin-antitoxin system PrlF family antitoxin [Gemmatimonadota bacterium]